MTAIDVDAIVMDSLNAAAAVVVVVVKWIMKVAVAEFVMDFFVAKAEAVEGNDCAVAVYMIGSNNRRTLMAAHNEMTLDNLQARVNNSDRESNDVRRHCVVESVALHHNNAHIPMNFDARNRVVRVNATHEISCYDYYFHCGDIRNRAHCNKCALAQVSNNEWVIDWIQSRAELISRNIYWGCTR